MTSREQFDDFVRENLHPGASNAVIRLCWMAWQASRQAVEIEIPERHYFCDNDGAFVDVSDVIYEIQHVGLKVKA